MENKFNIGKFVETSGEDVGRLKNDSPEAAALTQKVAHQEKEMRKGREKNRKRLAANQGMIVPGVNPHLTDAALNQHIDNDVVKRELGMEAARDTLDTALSLGIKFGLDKTTERDMQKAVEEGRKAHEDYDDIIRKQKEEHDRE